jgi:hypothetical protein
MKVAIGADHGGFNLKGQVAKFLTNEGYTVTDFGTKSAESCDYPVFAYKVAKAVSTKKAGLGILICKSGNGMAIVANSLTVEFEPPLRASPPDDAPLDFTAPTATMKLTEDVARWSPVNMGKIHRAHDFVLQFVEVWR